MAATVPVGRWGWRSAVLPGLVLMTGLGGVLGGVAGTVDWPVVGTFFGAVAGATAGAVIGVVLGVAMGLLARVTRSRWAARVVSGLVGLACLSVAGFGSGAYAVRSLPGVALVVAGALAAGALGPVIAFGAEPAPDGRAGFTWALAVGTTFLAWGGVVGAGAGAVSGTVIGLDYPPTAFFAAVEGGILGGVSGLVLGAAAAGIAVLPRLHPRP